MVVLNCCQSRHNWRPTRVQVHELWSPPMDKKIQETGLDILFVHGSLCNDTANARGWRGTWMQRDNPDVCWPEVWLPADLGFNARIVSFSYNDVALPKKDIPKQEIADVIAHRLCHILFRRYNQISCHFIIRNLSDCSSNPLAVLLCVCVCVCVCLCVGVSLSRKAVLLYCAARTIGR